MMSRSRETKTAALKKQGLGCECDDDLGLIAGVFQELHQDLADFIWLVFRCTFLDKAFCLVEARVS